MAMVNRGLLVALPVNNLYEAVVFIAWAILVVYLVLGLWSRLRFWAPSCAVLLGMGVWIDAVAERLGGPKPEFVNGSSSLHAALILLGYGASGLSSVAGLMYLTQEHNLKFHKLRAVLWLPPIERLERTIGRLLLAVVHRGADRRGHLGEKAAWCPLLSGCEGDLGPFSSALRTRGCWSCGGTFGKGDGVLPGVRWAPSLVMLTFWGTNLLSVVREH